MDKLFISNWAQGQEEESDFKLSMIDKFVKIIKANSPTLEIVAIFDQATNDGVSQYVKDNCTIRVELDQFNNKERHEWALVKVLTYNLIEDEEFIHMDYDIVFKTDISKLLQVIRGSGYDVVYQKTEEVLHPYYKTHIKENPELKSMFQGMKRRVAFNAGITYFKTKAIKSLYAEKLVGFYTEKFGDYISLEQLVIPNIIEKEGYTVGTVVDLLSEFESVGDVYIPNPVIDENQFNSLAKKGVFSTKLGMYHFLGELKSKPNLLYYFSLVGGLED